MHQLLGESKLLAIAKVCHQAIKAFCETNGGPSMNDWEEAEEWQRDATRNAVIFRLQHPASGYEAMHEFWLLDKTSNGWTFGEMKDAIARTHPSMIPYEQLPEFEKQKDALFCAIVDALR